MLACAVGTRIDIYPWANVAANNGASDDAGVSVGGGLPEGLAGGNARASQQKKVDSHLCFKGHKSRSCPHTYRDILIPLFQGS